MNKLEIIELHVEVEGKEILKGLSLTVKEGEIHAVMGPNGSGKSTLASTIMGHPKYEVTKGKILFNGESIVEMAPDERARKGVFLAFQYPMEIQGVSLSNFMRTAYNETKQEHLSVMEFQKLLKEKMKLLHMKEEFSERYLNEGFSGGEKKRCEILQMAILHPKMTIMDETDSGLDIDALKIVSEGTNEVAKESGMGVLLITHYQRILKYIKPHFVHVLVNGTIEKSGGIELAEQLEEKGYKGLENGKEIQLF